MFPSLLAFSLEISRSPFRVAPRKHRSNQATRIQAAVGAIRTRIYGFTRRSTVEIPPPTIKFNRVWISIRTPEWIVADYFRFFSDFPQAQSNTYL